MTTNTFTSITRPSKGKLIYESLLFDLNRLEVVYSCPAGYQADLGLSVFSGGEIVFIANTAKPSSKVLGDAHVLLTRLPKQQKHTALGIVETTRSILRFVLL